MPSHEPEHDQARAWFEAYLDGLGLSYEYEPGLGINTRPDYRIVSAHGSAICEVKAFRPEAMPKEGFLVRDMKEVLKTVRNSIGAAAHQLRPLAGKHLPLVVVLANPAGADVLLDETVYAMYGDMRAVLTHGQDSTTTATWLATRNGRLRNDHPYISGTLVLRQGSRRADQLREWQPSHDQLSPDELTAELNAYLLTIPTDDIDAYIEATYIEAPGGQATPLPEGIFVGEHAWRWRLAADGTITRSQA